MYFITSHFGKMNLWPVEHFWTYLSSLWGGFAIAPSKPTQKWGQICWKSVQLDRVSFFRSDCFQNWYFRTLFSHCKSEKFWEQYTISILTKHFPTWNLQDLKFSHLQMAIFCRIKFCQNRKVVCTYFWVKKL